MFKNTYTREKARRNGRGTWYMWETRRIWGFGGRPLRRWEDNIKNNLQEVILRALIALIWFRIETDGWQL